MHFFGKGQYVFIGNYFHYLRGCFVYGNNFFNFNAFENFADIETVTHIRHSFVVNVVEYNVGDLIAAAVEPDLVDLVVGIFEQIAYK